MITELACRYCDRCFEFENGDAFLVTDVEITCRSSEHTEAVVVALFAICTYPVGLFVLNGMLLVVSRASIVTEKPTLLSSATVR